MRTVQSNNFPRFNTHKRDVTSDKQVPRKIQRINNLGHEVPQGEAFEESHDGQDQHDLDPLESEFYNEPVFEDEINFLERDPYSPISKE